MLGNERIRAGFGARLAAYLIDRFLLALALSVVWVPTALVSLLSGGGALRPVLFTHSALDIVCYALSALYFVLMTYLNGATLGKMLLHIRVEGNDGQRPSFLSVLYRETVGRFLSGLLYIGYLLALIDSRSRAFHDWLSDTRVVYNEAGLKPCLPEEGEAPENRYPA